MKRGKNDEITSPRHGEYMWMGLCVDILYCQTYTGSAIPSLYDSFFDGVS